MAGKKEKTVADAAQDAFATRLDEYGGNCAMVKALCLHNPARCKDAYKRLSVGSASAGSMATDHRLKSGRVGVDECATFVLDLSKNSNAEEELRLAKLNAPDNDILDSNVRDCNLENQGANYLASSLAITILRPSRGAIECRCA